ncbi:MAG: NADH:ubiquinone reductase (Na(+)-transporting) subunit D [Flavobacteriales bacterium]|nr:NADH:ubiquinone reductase (Na(+)-transporting) subunit D [Bacteroidota bacterium]MCB9239940.1 NADH:ubiquinone reductase (Na(+)-transporting) subunit D [Flavobacteriales bacterium]
MSTEAVVNEEVAAKPASEPLFSKKNRKLISNPLDGDNPITVQILGICSALAVTVKLVPTIMMCVSVLFVLIFSNLSISMLRKVIPSRIRIIVQLLIVASLVAIVDQVLQAYAYDVSKQLSVFVGLIITNCIIMGRLEAFALANKPWPSVLDAVGNGLGYSVILISVAFFRELLGSGSLFGFKVLGENYTGNGVMMSPVGACIVLGLLIWAQRARNGYREEA